MSMHLVGPYMTTTSYKKRKAKKKTQRQIEADARHEKWLRKMNAHPEQIARNKERMLTFLFYLSLIIALIVQLSLLVMLFLEEAPPKKKDRFTRVKDDYWE